MKKNIAAAILAGGKASRLGGLAKGNILLSSGLTIIEHLLAELGKVGIDDTIIVSQNAAYQRYNKPMIADRRQNIGPLAGIEAVLSYYRDSHDATLFLPCDMPSFSACEMRMLLDEFRGEGTVFAVTSNADWHPLCAVVNNSWLNDISASIEAGIRSVKDVWFRCKGMPIFFGNDGAFVNVNTINDVIK